MRTASFRYLFLGALVLSGCGGARTIRLAHVTPRPDVPPARYDALKNVYIRIVTPSTSDLEKAVRALANLVSDKKIKQNAFDVDTRRFGRQLADAVTFNGGAVSAYRWCPDKLEDDPFVELLRPSSVLTVAITAVNFSQKQREEQVEVTDKDGKKKIQTVTHFDITARARLSVDWQTYPATTPLFYNESMELVGETSVEGNLENRQNAVLSVLQAETLDKGAADLINRLVPVSVRYESRPLLMDENQDPSVTAYKKARRGDWAAASAIWDSRVSSVEANWQDRFNLAVAAEQKRDYQLAARLYQEAREVAGTSPDAAKIPWDQISMSLSTSSVSLVAVPPSVKHWFGKKTVVLPFSDESNFVEASDLVRNAVYMTLLSGGYNVVALPDADERLRQKGITDGGQLPAVTPDRVAEWLSADFLVYGHLEDFNEVNVGVYRKRVVKGNISLWSLAKRNPVWNKNDNVVTTILPSGKNDVASNFFGGLFNSFVERLAKKPMGPEIDEFVRRTTRALPFR